MSILAREREEEILPLKHLHKQSTSFPRTEFNSIQPQQQDKSPRVILAVIAFYWAVSLAVVFLNKSILSSSENKFPFPLLVTFYQLLVALVLLLACGQLGKSVRVLSVIPPFEFHGRIARKISPLSIVYVLMLAFNNLCLTFVEVTFYQIARSLTIGFNVGFTFYILKTRTSKNALITCGVVIAGFLLGSWGEVNFSYLGLIFGVASSVFVALYGIFVKTALVHVDNDQWRLLHYNTAMSIPMMLPFILFSGEIPQALKTVYFWDDFSFWLTMTLTGVTGFLINIAVFLQIKYTTPLTNTISGTAKACVQTLLAWFIYQNPISAMNGIGIFLSLLGSGMYSWVRYSEMKK